MIHLRGLSLLPDFREPRGHPFELPLLQRLPELCFHAPVTFVVGENGCGKSTLLEALAVAARLVAVGSPMLMAFPGACIWHVDEQGLRQQAYEEVEHVRLTRDFLRDPAAYLRRL